MTALPPLEPSPQSDEITQAPLDLPDSITSNPDNIDIVQLDDSTMELNMGPQHP